MKRDLDLIREILMAVEQKEGWKPEPVHLEGYDDQTVAYHAILLVEAGLCVGGTRGPDKKKFPIDPVGAIARLTWDGHEFLDSARDDTSWNRIKEFVANTAMSASIATISRLLSVLTVQKFKTTLGG